ncbi:cell division protein ZapA [Acetobacteroides hydrogenigenes]|uniref:Cell division protein ZapA n=1 Tax=Acetobacteroides hydrogenigenes TaxID=979970 RepID=A0A4V2RPP6_9BACT|nr:cell division protein ZapA [Acetobacteroides hydrogenigenes]TCN68430.1 cell division protein ZapA [Acetobacteroides hydrogenigenes]
MEDKLSIRVNVADRFYPLKIDRLDEEKIRKAAKMINERLTQYQQRYADKDTQDLLAMAALQFVIRMLDGENKFENSPILEELEELNKEIDVYLSKVE